MLGAGVQVQVWFEFLRRPAPVRISATRAPGVTDSNDRYPPRHALERRCSVRRPKNLAVCNCKCTRGYISYQCSSQLMRGSQRASFAALVVRYVTRPYVRLLTRNLHVLLPAPGDSAPLFRPDPALDQCLDAIAAALCLQICRESRIDPVEERMRSHARSGQNHMSTT